MKDYFQCFRNNLYVSFTFYFTLLSTLHISLNIFYRNFFIEIEIFTSNYHRKFAYSSIH